VSERRGAHDDGLAIGFLKFFGVMQSPFLKHFENRPQAHAERGRPCATRAASPLV
jgi:hypothetical protein